MKALRFFCFMLLLGVVASCSKDEETAAPDFKLQTPDLIDSEDYQIYSIALNNVYGERSSYLTIMQSSCLPKSITTTDNHRKDELIRMEPKIDPTIFDDFIKKNDRNYLFDTKFSGTNTPVKLLSREEIDYFFKQGVDKGWNAYHKKYGERNSLIDLSRIGYNATKDQAILETAAYFASLAAEGCIIYLVKENNVWVVKKVYLTWAS